MATKTTKRRKKKIQVYDSTLKEWVQQRPEAILPLLLEGVEYQETLDVERIKPTMRVDRVYKVFYRGKMHILHLEFESGTDNDMPSRLLVYHAILYRDYRLPVISMIIYPFRVTMATSPWQEMSGDEALLTFHFRVLPLFMLEAEDYLQKHLVYMYPLLPTMQGATQEVLGRAMAELAALYRNDEVSLSQQFVWMALLLERTETLNAQEKREVQRRLSMYDSLWENHPRVKQIRAEVKQELQRGKAELERGKAELERGKAENKAELERAKAEAAREAKAEIERARAEIERAHAEIERARTEIEHEAQRLAEQRTVQELREMVVTVIKARFPGLAKEAREKAVELDKPEVLRYLIEQVSAAPDETMARWLLRPSTV